MEFSFLGTQVPQMGVYDNTGAHNQIKSMMKRKESLYIKFLTTRDGYQCAWIESAKVKGFNYRLPYEGVGWLFNYLREGKDEDSEVNPLEVEPLNEDEKICDFQSDILRTLIEFEMNVQFTPLFLETKNFISGVSRFSYGNIFFRVERTEELLDYLRENDALI